MTSRHRRDLPARPPDPTAQSEVADDDLPGLAREASARLVRIAAAADEQLDRVAADAARATRRGLRFGLVGLAVVLLAVIVLLFYTLDTALQAGQDAASVAASGELAQARQANIANARTDLATANQALVAAGLAPVPDPGVGASSQDLTAAVGEARGALRAIGELQAKGLPLPGVSVPDPRTGAFPQLTPDRVGP